MTAIPDFSAVSCLIGIAIICAGVRRAARIARVENELPPLGIGGGADRAGGAGGPGHGQLGSEARARNHG